MTEAGEVDDRGRSGVTEHPRITTRAGSRGLPGRPLHMTNEASMVRTANRSSSTCHRHHHRRRARQGPQRRQIHGRPRYIRRHSDRRHGGPACRAAARSVAPRSASQTLLGRGDRTGHTTGGDQASKRKVSGTPRLEQVRRMPVTVGDHDVVTDVHLRPPAHEALQLEVLTQMHHLRKHQIAWARSDRGLAVATDP